MISGLRPGSVILALSLLVGSAGAADRGSLGERLSARGIRDQRILSAFDAVPRDVFVPTDAPERAFDDKPLPAGYSQPITQPQLLARMVELLQLKPEARVLEVGGGTGYQAAILGQIGREVFSVGLIPELATTARLRLSRAGYQNVHVKLGDGASGWREYAPFDAVIVTSIGPRVPPTLIEQLVEGGVLVMAVGPPRGRQVLLRGVKKGFKLHAKEAGELRGDAPAGAAANKRDGRDANEERRAPRSDDSRSDR